MTKITITSLLLLLCTSLNTHLFSDAAPPTYPGYSLWPFDTKDVRMKSEKVDIYYGDVCKIEAVFEIVNPTKKIVEKKIGFPFNISAIKPKKWECKDTISKYYDFTLSLNGKNLVETDLTYGFEMLPDAWHGWTCKLKPNLNIVKLTYNTVTSYGNSGYRWEKTLYYNLNSNKNWPGKIDRVQVTMHFPEGIAKRQILAGTSPPGYKVNEKEITWRFTSLTPKPESDIALHFIDFKFFADMLKYETVLTAPNVDNAKKLDAAKFFASLAPVKGIDMSTPNYFLSSYYENTVLPNLKPAEKALFDSIYNHNKGNWFDYYFTGDYQYFKRNDSLGNMVMEVMNRIGYFEKNVYHVIYKYIEGAKKLFREVVISEPKNVAAWKAYIENYYLIETGACSPCISYAGATCNCPESQKELIREAFRYCGDDDTIALWEDYLFPKHAPLPETLEEYRTEPPQENFTILIKYNEESSNVKALSPDELGIVKKAYTMSNNGVFILKNTRVDEDTEKKLVEILGGCHLYWYKFCGDLKKLRKHRLTPSPSPKVE